MSSNTENTDSTPLSYRDSGVDIDEGDRLIKKIKPFAKQTMRPEVLTGIGGFGALFELSKKFKNPVLVSGTDGVGTKLKLAFQLNQHNRIGIDLVAMSVNDILVQGAEPLFFLDYFACGQLDVDKASDVVSGIATGCVQAGCALIGGETAEMPGMYPAGEYDLAGFAVGAVEKDQIIDGSTIQPGDAVIGLASSGAHSNGYSLIRKIIERKNINLTSALIEDQTVGDAIMAPTRIYVKSVLALIAKLPVKGIAHITGGGLIENVPRILPQQVTAVLDENCWDNLPLFSWLQQQGNVTDSEMLRVFNCGVGMILVVAPDDVKAALNQLQSTGETAWQIGEIQTRNSGDVPVIIK